MEIVEHCMHANEDYARTFGEQGQMDKHPAKHLAVLACMDCRIEVEKMLGLAPGDAHILRNAGGIVTDDVIRSLILSYRFLGIREILVINHTGCGLLGLFDDQLRKELALETGKDTSALQFHGFRDLENNLVSQVQTIKASPYIPHEIAVHGLIYDVKTGRLRKVV
ncbi:MAG: beta-class carbonic anhydrase [Candidatus Methylomirabilales bacterium]